MRYQKRLQDQLNYVPPVVICPSMTSNSLHHIIWHSSRIVTSRIKVTMRESASRLGSVGRDDDNPRPLHLKWLKKCSRAERVELGG